MRQTTLKFPPAIFFNDIKINKFIILLRKQFWKVI